MEKFPIGKVRNSSKAGSWYDDKSKRLKDAIISWLEESPKILTGNEETEKKTKAKFIISPHAGYRHCGDILASSYSNIPQRTINRVKRVFVLGPSHRFKFSGCSLSSCDLLKTPFGNLRCDKDVIDELKNTGLFENVLLSIEEKEHSLEMQFPMISHVFGVENIRVIPIMVSQVDEKMAKVYGKIFSKYFSSPESFFVISSDFTHWGGRFRYKYYDKSIGKIHEFIEHIDKKACDTISKLNSSAFLNYLQEYKNPSICGRRCILIMLKAIEEIIRKNKSQKDEFKQECKLIQYKQSCVAKSVNDSSVSYVSMIMYEYS